MHFLCFHPLWYRVEFRREWVVNGEEELRSRGDYIPKQCNIQCISVHCNIHCNIQYQRMQIPSPLWQVTKKKMKVLVAQLCPVLWDPMACSPPASPCPLHSLGENTGVGCHSLSRESSQPRDQTIASRFFTI